jgi:hypothetical protein
MALERWEKPSASENTRGHFSQQQARGLSSRVGKERPRLVEETGCTRFRRPFWPAGLAGAEGEKVGVETERAPPRFGVCVRRAGSLRTVMARDG